MISDEKICTKCRESWPNTTEFYRRTSSRKKHLQGYCIACLSDYNRGPAPTEWKTPISTQSGLPATALQGIFRSLVMGARA